MTLVDESEFYHWQFFVGHLLYFIWGEDFYLIKNTHRKSLADGKLVDYFGKKRFPIKYVLTVAAASQDTQKCLLVGKAFENVLKL